MLFRAASKRVLWAARLDNTPLLLPPGWREGKVTGRLAWKMFAEGKKKERKKKDVTHLLRSHTTFVSDGHIY